MVVGGDGADDDATLQVRAVVGSDAAEKHTMRARGPKKCPCVRGLMRVSPRSMVPPLPHCRRRQSRAEQIVMRSPPPPGDEKFMFHSCLSSVP